MHSQEYKESWELPQDPKVGKTSTCLKEVKRNSGGTAFHTWLENLYNAPHQGETTERNEKL